MILRLQNSTLSLPSQLLQQARTGGGEMAKAAPRIGGKGALDGRLLTEDKINAKVSPL